jgi:hypothetical protein
MPSLPEALPRRKELALERVERREKSAAASAELTTAVGDCAT